MSRQLLNSPHNPVTTTLCTLRSTLREAVTNLPISDQSILYQRRTTYHANNRNNLSGGKMKRWSSGLATA